MINQFGFAKEIGENSIYILFNRDWGGEDLDDNGVASFLLFDGVECTLG